MKVKTAEFVISNTRVDMCPKPSIPEYAFIGRSNVGKSSLINSMCNNKKLAKTSSTPGKTQLINHFIINNDWYLVDLPGYGFTKTPVHLKQKWMNFTRNYLRHRENLMCVFVLLDSRHNVQKVDDEFMEWLGDNGIPFVMVFTKMDKLDPRDIEGNIQAYQDKMSEKWSFLPQHFLTSSEKKEGNEEILKFIEETSKGFVKPVDDRF
ncbi:ribosome biogenesis GTP-binding protein YihA/YsxC [bacterium]|jgi:GTP-binding protein|nr:ribosome biogenesis GTP-binding protein YihA/YsxC [bacterium]|tara:strand:- start:6482 stop:7102 length:621 start_codon:yes stop_codon:yes gene_type:complete